MADLLCLTVALAASASAAPVRPKAATKSRHPTKPRPAVPAGYDSGRSRTTRGQGIQAAHLTPEKLQQLFACHASLATARPKTVGACGFLDARTEAEVTTNGGRVEVDLERGSDVDRLRQQVRAALAPSK